MMVIHINIQIVGNTWITNGFRCIDTVTGLAQCVVEFIVLATYHNDGIFHNVVAKFIICDVLCGAQSYVSAILRQRGLSYVVLVCLAVVNGYLFLAGQQKQQ